MSNNNNNNNNQTFHNAYLTGKKTPPQSSNIILQLSEKRTVFTVNVSFLKRLNDWSLLFIGAGISFQADGPEVLKTTGGQMNRMTARDQGLVCLSRAQLATSSD